MKIKRLTAFVLAFVLALSLCACGAAQPAETTAAPTEQTEAQNTTVQTEDAQREIVVTDMIGREVTVLPAAGCRPDRSAQRNRTAVCR